MDYLAYPIHLVTAHPFAFMAFVFIFIFGTAFLAPKEKMRPYRIAFVVLIVTMVLNFIVGHYINVNIIYAVGESGDAQVTSIEGTSTQYNDQYVDRLNVLLKKQDGQVVETYFRTDNFNVYPAHNAVTYPGTGDRFHVRYLKHFPSAFIIISNDDSQWASRMKCGDLLSKLSEARNKYQFDRSNLSYRKQYIDLINQVIKTHCYIDSLNLKRYHSDIEYIKQGKDLDKN